MLAEMDQSSFWKVVNTKRSSRNGPPTKGLKFGSTFAKNPDEVINGWCNYFTDIYKSTEDPSFDETHRNYIDSTVPSLLETVQPADSCFLSNEFTEAEIRRAISTLPLGKAGCLDNLVYEHIKYGGDVLMSALLKLFQSILNRD